MNISTDDFSTSLADTREGEGEGTSWQIGNVEASTMLETTMKLGISRQTVLQRVKRGELDALLVTHGRRKGLRIKVVDDQPGLFHE